MRFAVAGNKTAKTRFFLQVLNLLPEYLRAFEDYRMIVFGAVMVIMMLFRPQGLVANVRKTYAHRKVQAEEVNG